MDTQQLLRKGLRLEYVTLAWNVLECIAVLIAGFTSGSIALIAFGIDSVIEIFAGLVVVWQLKSIHKEHEKLAEKLIGVAFLLVAVYILVQGAYGLVTHVHALPSVLGIVSITATIVAMFTLAYAKGKVGAQLQHPVLMREAKVTYADGLLACSVLLGIVLNALLGWWWADPLAGLVVVVYGLKEGFSALKAE